MKPTGAEQIAELPALALVMLATAGLSLFALIRRELPKAAPLVPLDLLRARPLRVSVVASFCCFGGQAAAMVALPFYLQHGLGQSALATGLLITPWPLTVAVVAPIAGRLADRFSSAVLCATGGACLALGLAALALWPLGDEPLSRLPLIALCGLGFGLFQVPNNRNLFSSAPRARSGAAGGLQSTTRLCGQATGALLMSFLFSVSSLDTAPRLGMGLGAGLALSAGLVSLLRAPTRRDDARSAP